MTLLKDTEVSKTIILVHNFIEETIDYNVKLDEDKYINCNMVMEDASELSCFIFHLAKDNEE